MGGVQTGSRFHFFLHPSVPGDGIEKMTVERTINILLVEDNPDDALLVREMLAAMEFTLCRVHWVDLVSRARQWIEEHPGEVDLVLLDLFLPDSL